MIPQSFIHRKIGRFVGTEIVRVKSKGAVIIRSFSGSMSVDRVSVAERCWSQVFTAEYGLNAAVEQNRILF